MPEIVNVDLTNTGDDLVGGALDIRLRRPYYGPDGRTAFVNVRNSDPLTCEKQPIVACRVMPGTLSANVATLRKDEWLLLDTTVIETAKSRLQAVADLEKAGMVLDIGNDLGITKIEWQTVSDAMSAVMSMDGLARGQNDKAVYDTESLPLPLIHADYQINARLLASSRRMGLPMDTSMAEMSTDKVARYAENLLVNGSGGFTFGGGVIYGYTTYNKRTTGALTYDWSLAATTGAQILADVKKMLAAMSAKHKHGPFILYIPTNVGDRMDDDYIADPAVGTKTIRQRILECVGISDIRVLDYLPTKNALLVQMDKQTIRLVKWSRGIQTFSWSIEGGWSFHFKVATIMVPNFRSDQNGVCGLAHFTKA